MTSRRIFTVGAVTIAALAPLAVFAQWTGAPGTPPNSNRSGPVWLQTVGGASAQTGSLSVTGASSISNGSFVVGATSVAGTGAGDIALTDDLYFTSNNKSIRVDGDGTRTLFMGNYDAGTNDRFLLDIGDVVISDEDSGTPDTVATPRICLSGDCRTTWPTGTASDIWVDTVGDAMTGQLTITTNTAPALVVTGGGSVGIRGYGTGASGVGVEGYGQQYGAVFGTTDDSGTDYGVYVPGGVEYGVDSNASSIGVRGTGASEGVQGNGVTGVVGYGTSIGVFGYGTPAGATGIYGRTPNSGSTAVRARTDGASSIPLLAQAYGASSNAVEAYGTNIGVYANSSGGPAFQGAGTNYGLLVSTSANNSRGIYADADTTGSIGAEIYGDYIGGYFNANNGIGVRSAGTTYGGRFFSNSTGVGVQAEGGNYGGVFGASAAGSEGVIASGNGNGGRFTSGSGTGVYASGGIRGIYAEASGGPAGYFNGYIITTSQILSTATPSASQVAPSFSFNGDSNTGMYHYGGDQIGFTVGGGHKANIDSNGMTINGDASVYRVIGGASFNDSASSPSITFSGDLDTGLFNNASNQIDFTTGGTYRARIINNGTAVYTSGGGSMGAGLSDGRQKNIIKPFTYGLKELLQLNPIYYTYKEGNADGLDTNERHLGFIAQEVQKVMPDAIGVRDDGLLRIDSIDSINWASLNAIKELKTENDALKSELNDLKSRVEKLEKLLND